MPTAAATSAAHEYARRHTARETGLPLAVLPETCPFSGDPLLDDAFMGGPAG